MKATPPALVDALRRYAVPFEGDLPPVLALFASRDPVFPFAPDSPRGLAVLLLAAALHKPDGEEAAARLLAFLYARFGEELFHLNRAPYETLVEAVTASGAFKAARDDADVKRVPGILRSACDFLDATGPLDAWIASAPDWESRVRALAGAVYWMGKHSLLKTKARMFFWLAARGARPEQGPAALPQAQGFVWPAGEGHGRFYNDFIRAPRSAGIDPARRLALFARLGEDVFPRQGWKLFAPLDAYLRRGGTRTFRCREAHGGCKPCPLAARCPAAAHFIPGER